MTEYLINCTDPDKAAELKAKGNACFKDGQFHRAISHYSEAITYNALDPTIYSNRGACFMQLDALEYAMRDFDQCLSVEPSFCKAYLRKSQILERQGKKEEALDMINKGLDYDPSNAELIKARDAMRVSA